MGKREQLTEFNRNNILEAAQKLFEEKGLLLTTMDDIAKKADYSKSTIYVYFKSKDEIYNHIVYKSMLMLENNLSESIGSSDEYEKYFFTICNTLVKFQEEYPLYFESITGKIEISKTAFENQPILFDIYKVGEDINQIISKLLKRGIADNYFRKDLEPLTTMFALWASICGIISMASHKEAYLEDKATISKKAFLSYSFQMLLNSIR
jgi:AcrR family transcriptional regulator